MSSLTVAEDVVERHPDVLNVRLRSPTVVATLEPLLGSGGAAVKHDSERAAPDGEGGTVAAGHGVDRLRPSPVRFSPAPVRRPRARPLVGPLPRVLPASDAGLIELVGCANLPPMRVVTTIAVAGLLLSACGGDDDLPEGTYRLPSSEIDERTTAYIAEVVAAPPGDDLAPGAGEHVVIRNNAGIRIDMGGWVIEDGDGDRLPLGIGRQIDVGAELRVHPGPGETGDDAVFAGLDAELLDDDGDVVRLLDAAGSEVMSFRYPG